MAADRSVRRPVRGTHVLAGVAVGHLMAALLTHQRLSVLLVGEVMTLLLFAIAWSVDRTQMTDRSLRAIAWGLGATVVVGAIVAVVLTS